VVLAACTVEHPPRPSLLTSDPQPTFWATKVDVPADASTAEVLGAEVGSILVANVRWLPRDPRIGSGPGDFTGQPAVMRLSVVKPDGARREIARLFLPTGSGSGSVGPNGYLALPADRLIELGGRQELIHQVAVLDLRDPLRGEVARFPVDGGFAWSPTGTLAVSQSGEPRTFILFDPVTGEERRIRLDFACCLSMLWTADGSAMFATHLCEVPCESKAGLVDTATGTFEEVSELPRPYLLSTGYNVDVFDRRGHVLLSVGEFDDMGKGTAAGQVISAPAGANAGFDDPNATVWWDSRTSEHGWRWKDWDIDGEGVLAVRSVDGRSLELVRIDRPGHEAPLAIVHPGPIDPTAWSVSAVRDAGGSTPDVILGMLGAGPTIWYSGTSGRPIEIGRDVHTSETLETTVVLGWVQR